MTRKFAILSDFIKQYYYYSILLGGNQRDLARAKNQKKQQEQSKGKGKNDGLTLEQRKFR